MSGHSELTFSRDCRVSRLDQWCRGVFLGQLTRLGLGRVCPTGNEEVIELSSAGGETAEASVRVHDPRVYRRMLLGGSMGAAEAYMDGDWSSPDLVQVIRAVARQQALFDSFKGPWSALRRAGLGLAARLARNTRSGSRKHIAAHYDLGNDFFPLFLDDTLTYSAGFFETPEMPLREASVEKLDRICRKLQLSPADRILEIGTGWGSFALHAAGRYGCRVTTATISAEQHALATERVRAAGLADRVEVLLCDYRDLGGTYDKVVSIEMIEAVGHAFLNTYFRVCAERLRPGGALLLQAICSLDQDYDLYRRESDFIKRYIFPGGCLTSTEAMLRAAKHHTDLQLFDAEDITPHYALTLRHWRENFLRNRAKVEALGFDARFVRMWEFYLSYCEGGFAERSIHTGQFMFVKPGFRSAIGGPCPRSSFSTQEA